MKVYPFKIPKRPKEHIILQTDRGPRFYNQLHQHTEIQLSYIFSGKGKLLVGNSIQTFAPGDLVAIGANLPHLFLSQEEEAEAHMISLFFTKDAFGPHFFDQPEMMVLQSVFTQLPFGFLVQDEHTYLKALFLGLKNEDKFALFLGLLQLLRHLVDCEKKSIVQRNYTIKISKDQGERLQLVFDYVMQNFHNNIQLEQVAQRAYMSKNAFCRFFKQRTNKTFFSFLAEIRIQHACELMQEKPERTIAAIAAASGYQTISNFNKHFKAIKQMSPRNYKNKLAKHI